MTDYGGHRHRYEIPVGKPWGWSQPNEVGNREHYESRRYRCSIDNCISEKVKDKCVEVTRNRRAR